jgi:hypothetical protein
LKSAGKKLRKSSNRAILRNMPKVIIDYILRAGEYCRFNGFLNKGVIVITFLDDTGNEKASELYPHSELPVY